MPTSEETTQTTTTQTETQTGVDQTQATQAQGATPESFDEWLESQDEKVKGLVSKRFEALENTAKVRKEEREALSDQLKTLKKKQGDELRKAVDEMSARLEETEKRAAFLEDAMKPETQCRNPRAAWLLAKAEDLFDKRGTPDWSAIKAAAPELFGAPTANANAGRGTQTQPSPNQSMNAFIRKSAGRE